MAKLEEILRERLETNIKSIVLAHLNHVRNVLKLRDEMVIQVDAIQQEGRA